MSCQKIRLNEHWGQLSEDIAIVINNIMHTYLFRFIAKGYNKHPNSWNVTYIDI